MGLVIKVENDTVDAIKNSSVLDKIYDDLLHPAAEPVGEIAGYFPRTLKVWLGKWKCWIVNGEESIKRTLEVIENRTSEIPEDHLIEPPAHIAVPTIQQLAYCYDSSELRELYANLLLSSMDDRVSECVHPSYVGVLKEICPDEAKLLKNLVENPIEGTIVVPIVSLRTANTDDFVSYKFRILVNNYSSCCDEVCEHPEFAPIYLSNLVRLGIIKRKNLSCATLNDEYSKLESSNVMQKAKKVFKLEQNEEFRFERDCYEATPYGLNFLKTCVVPTAEMPCS